MARNALHASSGPRKIKLGPNARKARSAIARATKRGADAETIEALRREFVIARALETIEQASAEIAAVRNGDA